MDVRIYLGAVAALLIGFGLWIGLTPHAADGASCGSAFDPRDTSAYDAGRELGAAMSGRAEPLTASAAGGCASELDGLQAPAITFIVIGILGSGVWFWTPAKADA